MSMQRKFVLSLILTLVLGGGFLLVDPQLHNAVATNGTVSLELCAYSSACDAIVASWDEQRKVLIAFILGIDFLFLIAYSSAIYSALHIASAWLSGRLGQITVWVSYLALVAGIADAAENVFLIAGMLSGSYSAVAWPASIAATIKFSAIASALLWFFIAVPVCRLLAPSNPLQVQRQ